MYRSNQNVLCKDLWILIVICFILVCLHLSSLYNCPVIGLIEVDRFQWYNTLIGHVPLCYYRKNWFVKLRWAHLSILWMMVWIFGKQHLSACTRYWTPAWTALTYLNFWTMWRMVWKTIMTSKCWHTWWLHGWHNFALQLCCKVSTMLC